MQHASYDRQCPFVRHRDRCARRTQPNGHRRLGKPPLLTKGLPPGGLVLLWTVTNPLITAVARIFLTAEFERTPL